MSSDTGHEPPLFLLVHALRFCIHKSLHRVFGGTMSSSIAIFFIGSKTSHTRPSAGTSTLALVVARKRIPSSKTAPTFWTNMWPLSRMKLSVSLQIVESPEARLAGLADVRFFLAVCEQMALEVMMPSKFGRAVRATVFLCSWRALAPVEARVWQAEPATRVTEITGRHGVGESLIARFFDDSCFISMTGTVPIL
jgi:hypothetical protein